MDELNVPSTGPGTLRCVECGDVCHDDALSWRIFLVVDPDDPADEAELATYCPVCAVREFGPTRRTLHRR